MTACLLQPGEEYADFPPRSDAVAHASQPSCVTADALDQQATLLNVAQNVWCILYAEAISPLSPACSYYCLPVYFQAQSCPQMAEPCAPTVSTDVFCTCFPGCNIVWHVWLSLHLGMIGMQLVGGVVRFAGRGQKPAILPNASLGHALEKLIALRLVFRCYAA